MRFTILISVVAVLTLAACRESVGPAVVDQAPQSIPEGLATPTFNWLNGPVNPGNSGVVRGEGFFLFFITSLPDRDLFALHFLNDGLLGCRVPTVGPISQPFQFNDNAFHVDGEMWVTVFDNDPPLSPATPCPDVLAAILAEGVANVSFHTNAAGAPGISANGKLELVGGGHAHYNGQVQFAASDPSFPKSAKINLTPIGN